MKRNLFILALALVLVLSMILTGCEKPCKHQWQEANCSAPKTCALCAETEGTPLSHSWKAATCAEAKTCELCAETDGAPLGHSWKAATCAEPKTCEVCGETTGNTLEHNWNAATCTAAKTCSSCGKTEGEAAGHSWVDPTCVDPKTCSVCSATDGDAIGHSWIDATTDAPKTCSVCKATEGTRIVTDSRFQTSNCQKLFGTWSCVETTTSADLGLTDYTGQVTEYTTLTFNNDGTVIQTSKVDDPDEFRALMKAFMIKTTYDQYAQSGYNKEQADALTYAAYNMTIEELAESYISQFTDSELNTAKRGVYYVKSSKLYLGDDWSVEFDAAKFSVQGNTLTITDSETGENQVFTRT